MSNDKEICLRERYAEDSWACGCAKCTPAKPIVKPAEEEEEEIAALLERCLVREYNPFEPNNQTKLWHDLNAALSTLREGSK